MRWRLQSICDKQLRMEEQSRSTNKHASDSTDGERAGASG